MDQAHRRHVQWTPAKSFLSARPPWRVSTPPLDAARSTHTFTMPQIPPSFPSLFIDFPSPDIIHLSPLLFYFSPLFSFSPPLLIEVMTELPGHVLNRWTSRVLRRAPTSTPICSTHTNQINEFTDVSRCRLPVYKIPFSLSGIKACQCS